jgi:uncharacterized protein (TIGR00369 family)
VIAREVMIGMVRYVPQLKALGARYEAHGNDWVTYILPYSEKIVGFPDSGVIAGGAIYTLLDNASGSSVMCKMETFPSMATLDLRVDYLKPATPHKDVFARVECYKLTKSIAFTRGVAYHDDITRPIAHCTGTFTFSSAAQPRLADAAR